MSTPAYIRERLHAAGWTQLPDGDTWQRPGPHPDVHSFPVADLVRRTGEPHYDVPPEFGLYVARPAGQKAPRRRGGRPRRLKPNHPVAAMREQGMTFQEIGAAIGHSAQHARYLYLQAGKAAPVPA